MSAAKLRHPATIYVAARPIWFNLAQKCPFAGRRQLFRQFNLFEVQFHRRGPTKDRDRHLDPAFVEVEFFDQPVEAGEWAVEHLDRIADFVIDADMALGFGSGLFAGAEITGSLAVADRLWLAIGAKKSRYLGVFLTR
jgi:hypothetical protein